MKLTIRTGKHSGKAIEPDGRFEIGRDKDADLVLDEDDEVSRKHASLEPSAEGELELIDLESRNGTFVNGRRIKQPVQLKDGDKVRIGQTEFDVEGEDAGRTVLASEPPEKSTQAKTAPPKQQAPPKQHAPPPPRKPAERPPQFPAPERSPSGVREALTLRSRRATAIAIGAVVIAAIAIVVAVTGVFSSDDEPATTAEIVESATPSTVLVEPLQAGQPAGNGTGWVYDAGEGTIVTNAHVVDPGQSFRVGVDGQFRDAELLGVSPCDDLAVLRVSDKNGLTTLPLASGDDVKQGDTVVALGYPAAAAEQQLVATTGTVTVAGTNVGDFESIALPPIPDVVQTDAAINPGNSGGPLINDEKELVGVNESGLVEDANGTPLQNTNFAISVNRVAEVVPQLAEGESIGWLGFGFSIDPDGAGMIIEGAPDFTTAGQLGANNLRSELINSINGLPVLAFADYCTQLRDAQPGDAVFLAGPEIPPTRVVVE